MLLKRSTDSFLIGQAEKDIPSGKLPTGLQCMKIWKSIQQSDLLQDLEYQILPEEVKLLCTSLNEVADKVFAKIKIPWELTGIPICSNLWTKKKRICGHRKRNSRNVSLGTHLERKKKERNN